MHQEVEQRELGQAEVVAAVEKIIQEAFDIGYAKGFEAGQQDCDECSGCKYEEEQCCEDHRPILDVVNENISVAVEIIEDLLRKGANGVIITREDKTFTVTGSYTIC